MKILTQKEKDFFLKKRSKGKEIQVKVSKEFGWQSYLGTEFDHEFGEYRIKPKAKKMYFMVDEDRLHSKRQELIVAGSYNEAYLTYVNQIVKPMRKQSVAISLITKELAKDKDAPYPTKFNNKKDFKEKECDFYVKHKNKSYIIKANSFDEAINILEKSVKNFDKYDVEIRIAEDFLIKKTKRLN